MLSIHLPGRPVRRRILFALAVLVLAVAFAISAVARASADGSGTCPVNNPECSVVGTGGGDGGGTPGGGGNDGGSGSSTCTSGGVEVSCYESNLGYYNSSDNCYYTLMDPQPAAGDPKWGGHTAAEGAVYRKICLNGPLGAGNVGDPVYVFEAAGVAGPTPYEVALEALAKIRLNPPAIQLAPTTDKGGVGGLVGLPVWMWNQVVGDNFQSTWGPLDSSATDGGVHVDITAVGTSIVWNMGDGHSKTCDNPGTAYTAADGGSASPDCGYRYSVPSSSRASGTYTVTATATWNVAWAGAGQSGTIVQTRVATVAVRINQAQVVVK